MTTYHRYCLDRPFIRPVFSHTDKNGQESTTAARGIAVRESLAGGYSSGQERPVE